MARKQAVRAFERNIPVLSSQRMQRLALLLTTIGIAGFVYALVLWVATHSVFDVKSVQVRGQVPHLTEAIVRATVIKQMRGTFFTANLAEVKRLAEAIPWVRRAQVSRSWPNTIILTVEEHLPFARLNNEQLVNTFGEAFIINAADVERAQHLPLFQGRREMAPLMRARYSELDLWLRPIGASIKKLSLSDRLSWTAMLENGLLIELGRDTNPDTIYQRVQRLANTWPQLSQKTGVPNRIDLRYADGYAVQAPGLRIAAPDNKRTGI
jgi:cell division protein FtsQ